MNRTIPRRLTSIALLLASIACTREPATPPPTTTSTTAAASAAPRPDTKALEQAPGSTAPLVDAVVPATPPLPGLDGTPGPSPAAGRLDAPVRIVMFTDYECPVCRRALEPLKLLLRTHPDVVLVVKQAASPRHEHAAEAAAAALAAFRQGRFWAYQDALLVTAGGLDRTRLVDLAHTTGLDVDVFAAALDDPAVTARVRYETALAHALDLTATPSFVVNGHVQRGWGSYRGLESVVEREAVRARAIANEGIPPARVAYEATRRTQPDGPRLAEALFEPTE